MGETGSAAQTPAADDEQQAATTPEPADKPKAAPVETGTGTDVMFQDTPPATE
jgi:hypothetical protein